MPNFHSRKSDYVPCNIPSGYYKFNKIKQRINYTIIKNTSFAKTQGNLKLLSLYNKTSSHSL